MRPRLIVFDVDGTLVDSEAAIWAAMQAAYAAIGEAVPPRAEARRAIGLSLPVAFQRLSPGLEAKAEAFIAAYRASYAGARARQGADVISPLYDGARAALDELAGDEWTLLGIATGKSRRGVAALLAAHGLEGRFATVQTVDTNPSKPDPAMLLQCLAETGVEAADAVMVGDTVMDMEMARSAGTGAIGVSWGYHPARDLQADRVIASFAELRPAARAIWAAA